ncbi:DUF3987 domain-containing protein [Chitinibacter fontanus]|uniref:DUF3987 domain-containing protein n=1 Tax=Chitinibacter fontanus TaxID=1737446 RepID=A0A7D5V785_9NEIS|nr:YfjI family protein [Chitinibacter fontanus]QLI80257.1 DUF3987 domain-containing protein [Chitinibacter fontanus]
MNYATSLAQNSSYEWDLPKRTSQYVEQIHKKTGSPISLIVAMLLTVYSEAGQGVYDLQMPDGRMTPLGLFSLIIADSGEGKSAVLDLIRQAIVDLESELADQHTTRMKEFSVAEKIWKIHDDALKKELTRAVCKDLPIEEIEKRIELHQDASPKKPRLIKFSYSKFTPEAFLSGLKIHWPNVCIDLDEAGEFFNGRPANDLPIFIHAWDGKSLSKDTSVEQTTVFVKSPRVAGMFALQESQLLRYFERRQGEARGIGFWARFLVCKPKSTQGYRNIEDLNFTSPDLDSLYARMRELMLSSIDSNGEPVTTRKVLYFDPHAANYLIQLGQKIESSMMPDGALSKAKDHGSKKVRNIARIAAALSLFESDWDVITVGFVKFAENIMDYFTDEFLAVFGEPEKQSQLHQNAEALWEWLVGFTLKNSNRYVLKSEIMKLAIPTRLRKIEELNPAIEYLASINRIGNFFYENLNYIDTSPRDNYDTASLGLAINRYRFGRKKKTPFSAFSTFTL